MGLLLTGCNKVIEIDIPEHKQKAVVSCLFHKDSTFKMYISKSVGVPDDLSGPVENAFVKLYKNGVLSDTLFFNGNLYQSHITAQPNTSYAFNAVVENLEPVHAKDTVPDAPVLGSCSTEDMQVTIDEMIYNQLAKIEIIDPHGIKNYYELFLLAQYTDTIFGSGDCTERIGAYSDNPVFNENNFRSIDSFVFDDKLFDGETVILPVNYTSPSIDNNGTMVYFDYTLTVVLRSISKAYYDYLIRLDNHLTAQWSDIWDGVSVPVQMYSNIENGYGIFAGYNEVRQEVIPGEQTP